MSGRNYPAFAISYKDESDIVEFCQRQLRMKHTRADYEELLSVSLF